MRRIKHFGLQKTHPVKQMFWHDLTQSAKSIKINQILLEKNIWLALSNKLLTQKK